MNIQKVLKDIEKLIGLELNSIRRGAEITVEDMDWDGKRVILRTKSGSQRSRPFSEIERLWRALCQQPAVHVDSELGGSGSSRNQPETILANLPYIEWLTYRHKKHIALVKQPTHEYGTLKKMDGFAAVELSSELDQVSDSGSSFGSGAKLVVVSKSIKHHAELIESITGIKGTASEQGIYTFILPDTSLLLVSEDSIGGLIPHGTYAVLNGASSASRVGKVARIGSKEYIVHLSDGLSLLVER